MSFIDLTGGWRPTIGDPTLLGWATAVGYFLAAWLCWRAGSAEARGRRAGIAGLRPPFWFLMGAALVSLGVNKQLDLQTWLTAVGRELAQWEGWMEYRRWIQRVFVTIVTLFGLGIVLSGFVYLRPNWRRYCLGWVGMVVITCFVLIRVGSFHHVDWLLGLGWPMFIVDHLAELTGIALVAAGALRAHRGSERRLMIASTAIPGPASES